MKRLVALALSALFVAPAMADTPKERIRDWQRSIDRAAEAGDTRRVQTLRLEVARYATQAGDHNEAARQYELLLALRPGKRERVRLFVALGREREALGEYGRALSSYLDALHDEPKDYEASLALARGYARVELNNKAIERYRFCVKLNPRDAVARTELAAVYLRTGYLNKAIQTYKQAISLQPSAEAYLGLADCYVRQDETAKAADVLQQAKAKLPRAEYDVRLGDLYEKVGDLVKASAAWEEALRSDDKRDDVRLKLALAYGQLQRTKDSEKLLTSLAASYPASPLLHFLRAMALFRQGDRESARREALAVQRLAPTEVVEHYNEKLLQLLNP